METKKPVLPDRLKSEITNVRYNDKYIAQNAYIQVISTALEPAYEVRRDVLNGYAVWLICRRQVQP